MQYMIDHDSNGDGLIDGPQPNTLDGTWYGSIPWISSLYAAALRAGEEMATEMGDADFAAACRQKFDVSKSGHRDAAFQRRILHPTAGPGPRGHPRLLQRLRH